MSVHSVLAKQPSAMLQASRLEILKKNKKNERNVIVLSPIQSLEVSRIREALENMCRKAGRLEGNDE